MAPTVTRDTAKGWWVPATPTEVTTWLSGRLTSVPDPVGGYQMQEASGNVIDFEVGSGTPGDLTTSLVTYQHAPSGWTRKGVRASPEGGTRGMQNGFTVSGAQTELFIKRFNVAASAVRIHNYLNGSVLAQDAAGHIGVGDATPTINYGTAVIASGTDHPIVHVANNATSKAIVYTDQETVTLTGTFTPATNRIFLDNLGGFGLGNVDTTTMFALYWNSALSATQAAIIIDAVINGPAIASVAVTPGGPVNLNPLGATQALTCTATRVDDTTYDATSDTRTVWSTDNALVATVSSTGLVTAIGAGTCHITATTTSLNTTARASSVTVNVSAAITLTSITITSVGTPIAGGSIQFNATGNYSDSSHADLTTQVTWASSNTNVARIDPHTGIADFMFTAGSCQITATL